MKPVMTKERNETKTINETPALRRLGAPHLTSTSPGWQSARDPCVVRTKWKLQTFNSYQPFHGARATIFSVGDRHREFTWSSRPHVRQERQAFAVLSQVGQIELRLNRTFACARVGQDFAERINDE